MKQYLLLFSFFPLLLWAQNDERYLAGAVPEVDGRVTFTKEVSLPGSTQEQIYQTIHEWAEKNFNTEKKRIVYTEQAEGKIAVIAEDYVVFSSTALSLDRSLMNYRLMIESEDASCKISMSGIRYEYNVSYQKEPEKYQAETWITDKAALNRGKLNRISGKFRKGTIDYADELFNSATMALAAVMPATAVSQPTNVPPIQSPVSSTRIEEPAVKRETIPTPSVETGSATLEGFRRISPDRIPGNIIKMLTDDWMLITAGNDVEFNMMTASWGGLGSLFGKPTAICYINPARYTYQLMEKNDTYTLTFYTEAYRETLEYCGTHSGRNEDKIKGSGLTPVTTPSGSKAFGEAWMIIECKKLVSQSLSTESISNPEIKNEWLGKPLHKMYIGEIINVWIK